MFCGFVFSKRFILCHASQANSPQAHPKTRVTATLTFVVPGPRPQLLGGLQSISVPGRRASRFKTGSVPKIYFQFIFRSPQSRAEQQTHPKEQTGLFTTTHTHMSFLGPRQGQRCWTTKPKCSRLCVYLPARIISGRASRTVS